MRPEVGAGGCELVLGARAVEAQDRALGAGVHVGHDLVDEARGHRAVVGARLAQRDPQRRAVHGAHERLADHGRAPEARRAVPAVARQERHGVHDDEPLDALRVAHRPQQADRAPVVDEQPHPVDARVLEEPADEALVALHREVAVAALAGPPEAREVGREPAGPLQEGDPVVAARRDAVDVQHGGRARRRRRRAPEQRLPVELVGVLGDGGHGPAGTVSRSGPRPAGRLSAWRSARC